MNNLVSFFFFTTYSFRSTWYFCCSSIRFLIYSNWFTMSPCSSFPFYYNFHHQVNIFLSSVPE